MKIDLPLGFGVPLDMVSPDGEGANLFQSGFAVGSAEVVSVGADSWHITYQIEGNPEVSRIVLSVTGGREASGAGEFFVSLSMSPFLFFDGYGAEVASIKREYFLAADTDDPDSMLASFLDSLASVAKVRVEVIISGNDVINGTDLGDTIYLGDGNDRSRGFGGKDRIFGGDGGDILDGGRGTDRLQGGTGADGFVFRSGSGKDTVADFSADDDTLLLSRGLWSGTMTAAEIVDTFATFRHGRIELDFDGEVLRLPGIIHAADLVDCIQII